MEERSTSVEVKCTSNMEAKEKVLRVWGAFPGKKGQMLFRFRGCGN